MTNCVLRTEELEKSFLFKGKKTLILKSISLCLSELEFVCIVGASGCGKSTLLEILAGITTPDSGDVYIKSERITGRSGLLGYMPQDDLLFPWLNILENALLPVRIKKADIPSAKIKVIQLAEVFGLARYLEYHPWQLSGGLKQRAAFLRTCMTGAKVMLLDEPFANLDALTRLTFQDWLVEIKNKLELSIILVTHDLDEAFRLSDRIYVMENAPGYIDLVLSRQEDEYNLDEKKAKFKAQILRRLVK